MPFRSPLEIRTDADGRGMRRGLIVVAIQTEMQAVLAHLCDVETCVGRHLAMILNKRVSIE